MSKDTRSANRERVASVAFRLALGTVVLRVKVIAAWTGGYTSPSTDLFIFEEIRVGLASFTCQSIFALCTISNTVFALTVWQRKFTDGTAIQALVDWDITRSFTNIQEVTIEALLAIGGVSTCFTV